MKEVNRISNQLPDPVEIRRIGSGKLVRIIYATGLILIIGFFAYRFGAPLVFLEGPGVVSAPKYSVSLPYIVHIEHMNVVPGIVIEQGDEIATIYSPEIDRDITTLLQAITNMGEREATLRQDVRVGRATILENGRLLMEQQLAHVRTQFNDGRVLAPVGGIISSKIAKIGETVTAGNPIVDIIDDKKRYVDWFVPAFRIAEPRVGDSVFVVFGKKTVPGTVSEILPIADLMEKRRTSVLRDPEQGQMVRVKVAENAADLPLDSRVSVRKNYLSFMDAIVSLFRKVL